MMDLMPSGRLLTSFETFETSIAPFSSLFVATIVAHAGLDAALQYCSLVELFLEVGGVDLSGMVHVALTSPIPWQRC